MEKSKELNAGDYGSNLEIPGEFRDFFRYSESAFFKFDLKHQKLVFLSGSLGYLLGYVNSDFVGRNLFSLLGLMHSDERRSFLGHFDDLVRRNDSHKCILSDIRIKNASGRYVKLRVRAMLVPDETGKRYIVGQFNGSEDDGMDLILKEAREQLEEMFHTSPMPMFKTGIDEDVFLDCNNALAREMGYKNRQECLNKMDLMGIYQHPAQRRTFVEQLKKDGKGEFIFQVKNKKGLLRWIHCKSRIFPEHGYILGGGWDVTEKKLLSKTELKVLDLLMEGMTNKAIAHKLHKSVRTVEDHRANIMKKLGVPNVVMLAKKIIKCGQV